MTKYNWPQLIEEHAQSGLTQTAFCLARNLNPKYFNLKRTRYLAEQKSDSRFVAVQMSASVGAEIILHHGSVSLALRGVSADFVAALMRALT